MSDLARAIHDSGHKIVLAVTGGGMGAIHDLLTTPGASRSILEAIVPYSSEALSSFLGGRPDQFCSSAAARSMATAALERAKQLSSPNHDGFRLLGGGCTASLASDHPKQGYHRVHIAIQSPSRTKSASIRLAKGRRSRNQEDEVASALLMNLIHSHVTNSKLNWTTGFADEPVECNGIEAPEGWRQLLNGECAWASGNGERNGEKLFGDKQPIAIYSGAFHPRHPGHEQIARIGADRYGRVVHEISIRNVEKPPLDFLEMASRAAQFQSGEELVFSSAPTFVQKARIFPGCSFLVGVDTIRRIALPNFYGGEPARDEAIAELKRLGCRFLVFGRLLDGQFQEFAPSEVTPMLAELCDVISEQDFRMDVSSAAIRGAKASSRF